MADKDYSELTSATSAGDTDLVAIYPTGGPLKKLTFATFLAQVIAALGSTFLTAANNLSDIASASSARANLGLGTAAQLASSALFQVANNFSEVASAATARANIGAAAINGPTFTSGVTIGSGSVKETPLAVSASAIDLSQTDFFTKSISVNTTFTFANPTASTAQAFILALTITSAAVPTWPASVKWGGGAAPTLGNGLHLLGFTTLDGGTSYIGTVGAKAAA